MLIIQHGMPLRHSFVLGSRKMDWFNNSRFERYWTSVNNETVPIKSPTGLITADMGVISPVGGMGMRFIGLL